MPTGGITAAEPYAAPATLRFLGSLTPQAPARGAGALRVLDSMADTGANLVAAAPARIAELRRTHPGARILPGVF